MKCLKFVCVSFFIGSLLSSCQQQNPQPNNPTVTPGDNFITATIDGSLWTAQDFVNGCGLSNSYYDEIDYPNDLITNYYYAGFDQDPIISPITFTLNGALQVCFSGLVDNYSDFQDLPETFHNSFINLPSAYYQAGQTVGGPEIRYEDSNFELWSTRFGPQSSSSFVLTHNSASGAPLAPARTLKGNFNCTLYKESDPSQTKSVTNGSFRIQMYRN